MNAESPRDLDDALKKLTACLETPCVPGELEQWAASLRKAVQRVGPFLQQRIAGSHRDHYAAILEEDAEMQRQVVGLKKEDQEIRRRFDALAERSKNLNERAPQVEPDEAVLREDLKALVNEGLTFVITWQKQEIALRNWLQEAFTRDRGVVD